ncbi:hypothetical protein [Candidatus Venteria ishoeyi]|uniref:Uncharacterized protein n=1 Tax=Candidatus Venteria ishoeyi TaxID=1899563 RepID=A0A1H6FBT5_9GAMM|nr:hypothetical protein [Candidatus Venteria ishoeyi]SEH07550.1 Uncharacterised protein [Candidatus Venteria ishoeyi]
MTQADDFPPENSKKLLQTTLAQLSETEAKNHLLSLLLQDSRLREQFLEQYGNLSTTSTLQPGMAKYQQLIRDIIAHYTKQGRIDTLQGHWLIDDLRALLATAHDMLTDKPEEAFVIACCIYESLPTLTDKMEAAANEIGILATLISELFQACWQQQLRDDDKKQAFQWLAQICLDERYADYDAVLSQLLDQFAEPGTPFKAEILLLQEQRIAAANADSIELRMRQQVAILQRWEENKATLV